MMNSKHIQIKKLKEQNSMMIAMISIVLFVAAILPFILCIIQSVPSADDFGSANVGGGALVIVNAVRRANEFYMNWGGTWPTWFIGALLNPLNRNDYNISSVGWELLVFFLIWVVSLTYLLHGIGKYLLQIEDKYIRICITALVILFVINQHIYTETFYWYSGSPYVWWMSTTFVIWGISIKHFYYGKATASVLLLSIIGFITCFAQYYIIPAGFIYLLLLVTFYQKENVKDTIKCKIKIADLIPLFAMGLAALLSALSPGNYVRHEVIDSSGVHPIVSLGLTIKFFFRQEIEIMSQSYFVTICVVTLIMGILLSKYVKTIINPLVVVVSGIVVAAGAMYPIILGYSSAELPNRALFTFDIFNGLTIIFTLFLLGCKLGKRLKVEDFKAKFGECMIAAVLLFFVAASSFTEMPSIKQYLHYGEVCKQHDEWVDVLNEIRDSSDDDVIVYREAMTNSGITKTTELTADPAAWRNLGIAAYYKKNSVVLVGK